MLKTKNYKPRGTNYNVLPTAGLVEIMIDCFISRKKKKTLKII